jgi:hypothetical protein
MYEMNQIYLIINNNMQIDIVKAKETDDEYWEKGIFIRW